MSKSVPLAYSQDGVAGAAPRLFSIKQCMFTLGIGRTNLYDLIGAQRIKSVKIGRRRFVPAEAIDEFVASLSVQGRSA